MHLPQITAKLIKDIVYLHLSIQASVLMLLNKQKKCKSNRELRFILIRVSHISQYRPCYGICSQSKYTFLLFDQNLAMHLRKLTRCCRQAENLCLNGGISQEGEKANGGPGEINTVSFKFVSLFLLISQNPPSARLPLIPAFFCSLVSHLPPTPICSLQHQAPEIFSSEKKRLFP